jgi:uncharacterized membrane protein YcjF (UPF0283 family)
MLVAADYPFLDVFWTMILFFAWFAWIWIAITCFVDIFRRHDIGGWGKALWVVFIIVVPFLGVLVYLIAQHDGMRDRNIEQVRAQKAALDDYVRETAGGPATEIAQARELLDKSAITQEEFDAIKAKALSRP